MATNNDVNAAYSEAMTRLSHARDLQKKANKAIRQAEKALQNLGELVVNGSPFVLKQDWTPSPATRVATEILATADNRGQIVYECPYCPHSRHMGFVCTGCPCDALQYAIESAAASELTAAVLAAPLGRLV